MEHNGVPFPAPAHAGGHPMRMQLSLFLAFLLPCVGMSAVFVVYVCLLWYASARSSSVNFGGSGSIPSSVKDAEKGLSAVELEKLPIETAGGELKGRECAVCLEEIELGQTVRSLPGCHHGFHLECADGWLSKHSACPLCRSKIPALPPLPPPPPCSESSESHRNMC